MPEDTELKRMGVRRDPELYAYVLNAYNRSRKFIEERQIFERIGRYKKMYENNPWEAQGVHREGDLSEVKVAIAYDIIETGLPVATGRMPVPDIDPCIDGRNAEYLQIKQLMEQATNELELGEAYKQMQALNSKLNDYADKLQRELVKTFKDTDMFSKMRMGYREKGTTGNFVLKSVYDPTQKKIINEPIDYSAIYPSPNCDNIESHTTMGEPFCYAPIVSTKLVKKRYGIEFIESEAIGEYDEAKKFKYRHQIGMGAKIQTFFKRVLESGVKDKEGYVLPIECYMPSDEEVEFDDYVYDDDGQLLYESEDKPKTEKKKRSIKSKRVTIIKGHKDWIVEEVENLYPSPPFMMTKNAEQLGDFWGVTDIQMVEDLIMRLDISASNVHDNLRLTGNPKLIKVTGSQAIGEDGEVVEYTNEIGGVYETPIPNGVYYLAPPPLGVDVKWWMDFLKSWIDRITHLSDALRGFNEFAKDSGRKVQELRIAAANTFKPKLDEQVEFCCRLYKHWAWIYQNLWQEPILQKLEDEQGEAQFEEFHPQVGNQYLMNIDVAATSILPIDVLSNQEMAFALFDRKIARPDGTQRGLISVEQLLDICGDAGFEDIQRAKEYNALMQMQEDQQKQKVAIYEQFKQLAMQAGDLAENGVVGEDEDNIVMQLIQMVEQVPELIGTNEFLALPDRTKLAILSAVGKIGQINEPVQANNQ